MDKVLARSEGDRCVQDDRVIPETLPPSGPGLMRAAIKSTNQFYYAAKRGHMGGKLMALVIGSDKSGYLLKEAIKTHLKAENIAFIEVGTTDPEVGIPFFKVAPEACALIGTGKAEKGILICGTGMGMSQVANKYKGIRAACVESVYAARMCRAINDSNVLCMGGWVIAPEMGLEMVKTFLSTGHTEGLEEWRQAFLKNALKEVYAIEEQIYG